MKPGMTIVPEQSTTSASAAVIPGAICAILFPSISTSAFSKSPIFGSSVSTTPPRSRMRRLRASPTRSWVCAVVVVCWPLTCEVPHAAAAIPATAVAAVRNSRRDASTHDVVDMVPPSSVRASVRSETRCQSEIERDALGFPNRELTRAATQPILELRCKLAPLLDRLDRCRHVTARTHAPHDVSSVRVRARHPNRPCRDDRFLPFGRQEHHDVILQDLTSCIAHLTLRLVLLDRNLTLR